MEFGYNLKLENPFDERYIEIGKQLNDANKTKVYNGLDKLIGLDGDISGSKIQEEWFPQIKVDIFLSHSHNDEERALGLVGWLNKNFGLNVFIDSTVWKSADKLLKIIDDEFCSNGNGNYSYEKRNLSTSHVHMVLAVSLAKMLNKSEALFLLNTPNVISSVGVIEKTDSPWIYFELVIAELLREKEILRKSGSVTESYERMPISHEVNTEKLFQVNDDILKKWYENRYVDLMSGFLGSTKIKKSPLDILLNIVQGSH